MHKTFFNFEHGQIHARLWHEDKDGVPLLCLPPAPHTGLYYSTLARYLDHPMIGIDYPGSGSSCPLPNKASIEDYAASIGAVLPKLGRVNLIGFHSGCLVALELAQSFGTFCDKVICVDVPLFDPETRVKYAAMRPDVEPAQEIGAYAKSFEGMVVKWRDKIGEDRALELWIESLRAGPRFNDTFQAAFAYDADTVLENCEKEVEFMATTSSLLEGTRRSAQLCPNSNLTEVLEVTSNVFETGAPILSTLIKEALQ